MLEGSHSAGELTILDVFDLYIPGNARTMDHGYLVKDGNLADWVQPMWTASNTGGTVSGLTAGDPGSAFKEPSMVLDDTSSTLGPSAVRRFLEATSGSVATEAKLRFASTPIPKQSQD